MFRQAAILTALILPLAAANPLALAPASLAGEPTEAGFHLSWSIPVDDVNAILVHVINETGTSTMVLPGYVTGVVHPGAWGDVYVVQYQQGDQTSAPSNPVQWGPLGYPYCSPTGIILIYDDPIGVDPQTDCLFPLPI